MDLLAHAARLGVRVQYVDGLDRWGRYDHTTRTISIRTGLAPIQWRCVLAHELGHAHWGHDGSCPRAERQADEHAVILLVSPGEWEAATVLHDSAEAVAHELGILPRLVEVACDVHQTAASAAARSSSSVVWA